MKSSFIAKIFLFLRKKIATFRRAIFFVFKKRQRTSIASLLVLTLVAGGFFYWHSNKAAAAWWNDSWQYRKSIQITNNTTVQTNVFVALTLDTSDTTKFKTNCGDLRFTNQGGNLLQYFVVSGCGTASTAVHVNFESFPAGAQTIFEYYGNPTAADGFSSDDFATEASNYAVGAFGSEEKTTGPLAYWKFDEGTGTVANDSVTSPAQISATGGTVQDIGGFRVHTFTSSGTFTVNKGGNVEVLVVGGGGGGGSSATGSGGGGGGGAGGLVYNTSVSVTQGQAVAVTVGGGGAPGTAGANQNGSNGQDSVFGSITANGGGYGARTGVNGGNGGSGGGGGYNGYATVHNGGTGVAGQGNAGGNTSMLSWAGGAGGGGAGGIGGDNKASHVGGDRGPGLALSISGSSVTYATGGAGGANTPVASPANVGKGGDAAYAAGTAFAGGSGVVIVRYPIPNSATLVNMSATSSPNSGWQTEDKCLSGKCLAFDGVNDNVSMGVGSDYFPLNTFSVCSWIKTPGLAAGMTYNGIFSMTYGLTMFLDGSGNFNTRIDNGTTSPVVAASGNLYDNNWHQVCLTYDGTNRHLFTDGVEKNSTATTWLGTTRWPSNSVNIGFDNNNSTITRFNGLIDEPKIYAYARSAAQIAMDYNAGLAGMGAKDGAAVTLGGKSETIKSSEPVGYWKMDEGSGLVTNNSGTTGSSANGALAGITLPTWTSDGKFGKALSFSNGYVQTTLQTINSTFTYSAWFKPTTAFVEWAAVVTNLKHGAPASGINIVPRDGSISVCYGNGVGGYLSYVVTAPEVVLDQWSYAAVSYDGTNIQLYVNGVLKDTRAATVVQVSQAIRMGIWASSYASYKFNGFIDEVKIYDYALSSSDVATDYNQGKSVTMASAGISAGAGDNASKAQYCVPGDVSTCNSPVAEWNFDEKTGISAKDTSGNGTDAALVGSPLWTQGKTGSALKLDGSSQYLNMGDVLDMSTNSFTTNVWVKTTSTANTGLIGKSSARGLSGRYATNISAGNIVTIFEGSSVVTSTGTPFAAYADGKWHMITTVFDRTGNMSLYVDGALKNSTSISGQAAVDMQSTDPFYVGQYGNATGTGPLAGYYFNGSVDNAKVYNYARTPAQIAWDFNRGAPIGWWKMDECQGNTLFDASGNGDNGAVIIGASGSQTSAGTCSTASTAWGNGASGKFGSSLKLDGIDDAVTVPHSSALMPSSITATGWIKFDADTSWMLINKAAGGTSGSYYIYGGSLSNAMWSIYGPTATRYNCSMGALTVGTWYHLTGTFDAVSGKMQCYVDGNLKNTINGAVLGSNASNVYIGRYTAGYQVNGQVDDVRIYNYALTKEQIANVMNEGSSLRFGPSVGSP
ncbi:MAG: DUF2341 domain-containing protein [Candidatus Moranbacteria bacterium]|nr:DUF2341 domain-containing protein [Candidatus Moranbacteria bacterium]